MDKVFQMIKLNNAIMVDKYVLNTRDLTSAEPANNKDFRL